MSDIINSKLRRLDVTSLSVFVELMRHRKAVLVAERLNLTQSAISHILKRLRETFDDELFLRKPHGLEPTHFAGRLEGPISEALELLQSAVGEQKSFEAGTYEGTIRMCGFDYEVATILPPVLSRVNTLAPNMKISSVIAGRAEALDKLSTNEIDIAMGVFWEEQSDFIYEKLIEEEFVVVCRETLPEGVSTYPLEKFVRDNHLIVSPAGDLTGIVDESLAEIGHSRNVAASVPAFLPALVAASETGFLLTYPRTLARRYGHLHGLNVYEHPISVRPFTVYAVRHKRDRQNLALQWVIELIKNSLDEEKRF